MIEYAKIAIQHAAVVGVLACLISESEIAAKLRLWLNWRVMYCPICLGFWLALPALYWGLLHYFTVIALSNLWMLVILKVYEALDATAEDTDAIETLQDEDR
jgi:hypothetical protein